MRNSISYLKVTIYYRLSCLKKRIKAKLIIYILIRLKDRADMPAVFRIKFKALFSEVSQFLLQKRQELPDMPPVHKGMVDKDREGDRDPVFFAYSAVDQA